MGELLGLLVRDQVGFLELVTQVHDPSVADSGPVVDEVTRLWEQSLRILDGVLRQGVEGGALRECDTWAVANILWTVANSVIQSEATLARRELRRSPLEQVYQEAFAVLLRGLCVDPGAAGRDASTPAPTLTRKSG